MPQQAFDQVAGWEVDLPAHELRRNGVVRRLEPKVARVLGLLLARRGRVVRRDELLEHAWPGMVVGDDAVTNTIIKLRRALDDRVRGARIIETVPKTGYRLRESPGSSRSEPPPLAPSERPTVDSWADVLTSTRCIVVRLEYAADGDALGNVLEAELGAELSRCPWLQVVLSPNAPCHFLCRVTVASGFSHLVVQLIERSRGTIVWSARLAFSAADASAVAPRIAAQVEGVLLSSPEWLRDDDAAALSEPLGWVLRGIRHMNGVTPAGTAAAQDAFRRAIALDARYARAHACLAWCLRREVQMRGLGGMDARAIEASEAVRRAFALAPTDPFVLVHAGTVAGYIEGELRTGLDLVELSRERDPNFVRVWAAAAEFAAFSGDHERSAEHARLALEAAPADPSIWVSLTVLARARYAQGAYDEATDLGRQAVWRNGLHEPARLVLAASQCAVGASDDARETLAPLLAANPTLDARTLPARYAPQHVDNLPKLVPHLMAVGLRAG